MIVEERLIATNVELLMEEILAWDAARPTPELQPVPIPGDPLGASRAVWKLEGDGATFTKVWLPDSFSDLAGLRSVVRAHVKGNRSRQQQRAVDDAALRQSIAARFRALGFTNDELRWLDERLRG